jgi:hypothetical protein
LTEYVLAKKAKCKEIHKGCNACSKCSPLIDAAYVVLNEGTVSLPYLWNRFSPNIPYKSGKAKRKILQMPVCALNVSGAIYITEKKETFQEYSTLQNKTKYSQI